MGWYRLEAGKALGEATGFLSGLMILTGVLAINRAVTLSPATRAGEELLKQLREKSARLRSAPTASEVGIAVSLFGTAVLVGTPFAAVHAFRQVASDSDSGCGSSDSGCGGGGCGGCGG